VKVVKERMYVSVLRDTPTPRYFHGRVTSVTDQSNISVEYGGVTLVCTRLTGQPGNPQWRVNRFGAGT
jgi:hypothetical protein